MRKTAVLLAVAAVFAAFPAGTPASIDKLQAVDGPRFGVGMLRLYYNIGRSFLTYTKTIVLSLDDLPKAVATDVLGVGTKGAPGGYYMTPAEKREKERLKLEEDRLEKQQKGAAPGGTDNRGLSLPFTKPQ